MVQLRQDAVEWREVEGEIVALDLRTAEYLTVNAAGTVLWPRLAAGASLDELVACLVATYAVEPETAGRDVRAFVSMLEERQLLHP